MLRLLKRRVLATPVGWRWVGNWKRTWGHRFQDAPTVEPDPTVPELRRSGIHVTSADKLFDETSRAWLEEISRAAKDQMRRPDIRAALGGRGDGATGKEFLFHLLGNELPPEGPHMRLALSTRLLRIANGYLGMRSFLRSVEVWLNVPTTGPARETQLWHRDGDDARNLKIFIYLHDVETETGPFCYVPGTQPGGPRRLRPAHDDKGRVTDEAMARLVAPSEWRKCTGKAGSVVMADTIGFHKGLKPSKGHRLLMMIQYTSGTAHFPRTFHVANGHGQPADPVVAYALHASGRAESGSPWPA